MTNSNTCPNTKELIILGRNPEKRKAIVFNPRCNTWDCAVCWQYQQEKWCDIASRGVANLLLDNQIVRFVTLTGRGYYTPTSSIYFMRTNWPKLHRRIKYRTDKWADVTGIKWRYLLIPEMSPAGRAHWHMLCTTFEDRDRWWKDNAFQCGFGYIADVQNVDNSVQAGRYVAKYLTKDAGGASWPKNFRRARRSRNWPASENILPDGFDYERVLEPEVEMAQFDCLALGWEFEDLRGNDNETKH